MAKKEEAPKKKTTTVILTTPHGYVHLSEIARDGGWPTIVDRSEHAVEWLKAHGYKITDIELVGQKPANWDTVWEIQPPAAPEPVVEAAVPETVAESAVPEPIAESQAVTDLFDKAAGGIGGNSAVPGVSDTGMPPEAVVEALASPEVTEALGPELTDVVGEQPVVSGDPAPEILVPTTPA